MALVAIGGFSLGEAPPFTVLEETKVTLSVRVTALAPAASTSIVETLVGPPGALLSLSRTIEAAGGPVRVFLAFTADPDPATERCRVATHAEIALGARTERVKRTLWVGPGQLALVDLWSAPQAQVRLLLGLSALWSQTPRVVLGAPEATPVQFFIESALRVGTRRAVLEERWLSGLVGSPIRYAAQHFPGQELMGPPAPDQPRDAGGALLLELLPIAVEQGRLLVSARLALEHGADAAAEDAAAPRPRRETLTQRQLAVGEPLELLAPVGPENELFVLRITAYF